MSKELDLFQLEKRFLATEQRIKKLEDEKLEEDKQMDIPLPCGRTVYVWRNCKACPDFSSCEYRVTKEKVEWVRPEGEDKTARYFRFYQDEHIALHLGETTLRFVVVKDSTAYNIPLERLKEVLCNNETHPKPILEDKKEDPDDFDTESEEEYEVDDIHLLEDEIDERISQDKTD